jgi:hypothetical protein
MARRALESLNEVGLDKLKYRDACMTRSDAPAAFAAAAAADAKNA